MTIDPGELLRRIAEVEALAANGIPALRSPELWPAELLGPRTDALAMTIRCRVSGSASPRLPGPRGVE
jgi:hypothetical protein